MAVLMGTSELRAGGAGGVVRWKARYTGRREAWKGPGALGLESVALWEGGGVGKAGERHGQVSGLRSGTP